MTTVNRAKTLDKLRELPRKDLLWLKKQLRRESNRRYQEGLALKERLPGAFLGLANVMAGVSWALACRASLRRSKEHYPPFGKRPQSGEMWLPIELVKATRLDIKERGWSPLSCPNWPHFQAQQLSYASRRTPVDTEEADRLVDAMGAAAMEPLQVAKFHVRMAREEAAVRIPVGTATRFGS